MSVYGCGRNVDVTISDARGLDVKAVYKVNIVTIAD